MTSELYTQAVHLIEARGLHLDDAQQRMLARLADWLQARLRPSAWWRRTAAGAYLWGGVGRGKSLLLAALFEAAPLANKRRVHVHALLQDVQQRMLAHTGQADPLLRVADELASEARLLYLDEFHVHDIGDAILLGRLLQPLIARGCILLFSSNYAPAQLCPNPLYHSRFKPFAALLEKRLALIADLRSAGRDSGAIVERLLAVVGEDPVNIDRKNRDVLTNVRLPIRFAIASNQMPRLPDNAGALAARALVLEMPNSFIGQEDHGLPERLTSPAELSGILLWALDGLPRLRERGRFLQPVAGQAHLDELRDLNSPLKVFTGDCCEIDPDALAPVDDVYRRYTDWSQQNGDRPLPVNLFTRDLRVAMGGKLKIIRPRSPDRRRCFVGLRLRLVCGYTQAAE